MDGACKVVYPGNRRFLPTDHSLRKDRHNVPEHLEEARERPPSRSFHQDICFHKAHDNAKNNAQSSRIATGTGFRNMYVLAKKNPTFDRVVQTVPDAMHTIAVQIKHLVKCIAGKAPEDSVAVRMQEKSLGRFKSSCQVLHILYLHLKMTVEEEEITRKRLKRVPLHCQMPHLDLQRNRWKRLTNELSKSELLLVTNSVQAPSFHVSQD